MGVNYFSKFDKVSFGSIATQLVAMGLGVVLLFFGYKLVQYVLYLSGFAAGFLGFFWITSEIMSLAKVSTTTTSCLVLGLVPLAGGLLGLCLVQKLVKLTFFCYGGMVGMSIGHFVYVLGVSHLENHFKIDHALCYYGTLVILAILGGLVAIKLEDKILAVATAIAGSFCFSFGFWTFLTSAAKLSPKWSAWITPCMLDADSPCLEKIKNALSDGSGPGTMDERVGDWVNPASVPVLVPVLLAVMLALAGFCVQVRLQRKNPEKMQPMPYGGAEGLQSPFFGNKASSYF